MPPHGSATLSPQDISRQAMLMSAASPTCERASLPDTGSAISSPASADGPSRSGSPAGPTTDLFGQALVPASPSAPPARARRAMTNATCGLSGFLSSPSAALQSSLESRLRRQLDGAGSTLFSLTWKRKATPAGRPYCQLAASARRTSGSGFGSWPTPCAVEVAILATWPTPQSRDGAHSRSGQPERTGGQRRNLDDYATLASWVSPTARDHQRGVKPPRPTDTGIPPSQQVGMIATGFPASTEKRGQLNPAHSRWLMGYPAAWDACAPMATRSRRKSPPSL